MTSYQAGGVAFPQMCASGPGRSRLLHAAIKADGDPGRGLKRIGARRDVQRRAAEDGATRAVY